MVKQWNKKQSKEEIQIDQEESDVEAEEKMKPFFLNDYVLYYKIKISDQN